MNTRRLRNSDDRTAIATGIGVRSDIRHRVNHSFPVLLADEVADGSATERADFYPSLVVVFLYLWRAGSFS